MTSCDSSDFARRLWSAIYTAAQNIPSGSSFGGEMMAAGLAAVYRLNELETEVMHLRASNRALTQARDENSTRLIELRNERDLLGKKLKRFTCGDDDVGSRAERAAWCGLWPSIDDDGHGP